MPPKPKYVKKDHIEHVLTIADMYIGSIRNRKIQDYVALEVENGEYRIIKDNIDINPGLLRIFVEALSNAIDNVKRSETTSTKCTKIKVNIDKDTGETIIWNDGQVVPIEVNDEGDYNHTMIFGQLMTSSNYDDEEERLVSGRNGIGIKATNIYSKSFQVRGFDPEVGKIFEQNWANNMRDISKPKITSHKAKNGFTEIKYIPDFERFGMKSYTDDTINLYRKYVCDAAMLTKISVYFNENLIPVKNLVEYSKLYNEEQISGVSSIKTDTADVVITPSNGEYEAISFVNGVYTFDGGKHVDSWSESIFRPLVQKFNKPKKPQINITDIKKFFRIFVNVSVVNPEFSSQSKTCLVSPEVPSDIPVKNINAIMKWNFVEQIEDIIRGKEFLALKKTEKKTRGFKKIEGLDHANNAGSKLSKDCVLILTEGLSAKTYAVTGIQEGWNGFKGRDFFGVFGLRGKVLNTRNAIISTIAKNKEITDVIQALGVRYGVDYKDDKNFETLNYGKLMILADADDDGIHIKGLILNFIHSLFPSLLERDQPFVISMQTPIVKVFLKTKSILFYDQQKFKEYSEENSDKKLTVKYYKGLGTSSDTEVLETFGKRVVELLNDKDALVNMNKVFHKSHADDRKVWIGNYNPNANVGIEIDESPITQVSITDFIDKEMIKFSISDCARSIPNMMDGFKESHRKTLYACFLKKLNYGGQTLKVAQLAGFVAEKTNYHHGEQNLFDTITKMAHDFPGSNNIPLLFRDGQFGSRNSLGKDAANARYIFTKLDILTRLIFRPEDDCLLERVVDDGDIVEPKFYVPIIPMVLVNGVIAGIGTGWSCNVPSYNPLDIIECIKIWLKNRTVFEQSDKENLTKISLLPELKPWYRGFEGRIEKESDKKYTTYGRIIKEGQGKDKVMVDELPISMSIDKFKEYLEEQLETKNIKSMKNYSTPTKVKFIITENNDGIKCNEENLKLKSYIYTSNMVLFTEKEQLNKFETVDDIIESFCIVRYDYYIKRKEYILKELNKELKTSQNKARFLREVMNDELIIFKRDESDISKEMETKGYDKEEDSFDYLLRLQVRSFTRQKIEELETEIENIKKQIKTIQNTSETQMWINDLDAFTKAYNTWLKSLEKSEKSTKSKK